MAELSNGTVLRGQTYSYRIERMLGSGTFGITYLAVVSDGAGPMNGMLRVCVKEFYMHDINGRNGSEVTCSSSDGMFSEYRRKFMREAENLASITIRTSFMCLRRLNKTTRSIMSWSLWLAAALTASSANMGAWMRLRR